MTDILIAVLLDFLIGDPYSFPHPVKFMGSVIRLEERIARSKAKSRKNLRDYGFLIVIINILLFFFIPFGILKLLEDRKVLYRLVNIYMIYTCIAARALDNEAVKVRGALAKGIDKARYQLSMIVGRDTRYLEEEDIIKATIETVAENTSDGVIGPLLFIFLLGAPGGMMYKAVNTMDSMLGYKSKKYIDLGRYPAIVDDIYNYIPARLTGMFMCISSIFKFNFIRGFKIMFRDRKNHASPNAGWPEAAVAGLLGIQLGGPGVYHGELVDKPTMGDKTIGVQGKHIIDTIQIMYRTEMVFIFSYILIFLVFFI